MQIRGLVHKVDTKQCKSSQLICWNVIGKSFILDQGVSMCFRVAQIKMQCNPQAPQAHNAIIYHLVREFNGEKS